MEDGYHVPKEYINKFSPEIFQSERHARAFFENNEDLLNGLSPDKIESVVLSDNYALHRDGSKPISIDVKFRPEYLELRDEQRVIPWMMFHEQGDHLIVRGGPIVLNPSNVMSEDDCAGGAYLKAFPERYVAEIADMIGATPINIPLTPGNYLGEVACEKITFDPRYETRPLIDLGQRSSQAERMLIEILKRDGKRDKSLKL